MKDEISIIIPSFNESKNLGILIPKIRSILPLADIIIVDDSTGKEKDKTRVCISILKDFRITLISRSGKGGRGSAVTDGMREALKRKDCMIVVEMDADLAHDPDEIPLLLSKIPPADMVIGSRYLIGSHIVDWPKNRLIQSRIINFVLKYWLGLRITDYTNGFRAYTRHAALYLVSVPLYEKGFISLSETAYLLQKKKFDKRFSEGGVVSEISD